MKDDCIFCKIIQGQIPCSKIYEDDKVLAFMDINPVSDGHCLVIPKQHYARIEDCPAEALAELIAPVGKIAAAVRKATGSPACNVVNNNGLEAGQLVKHLHFHIVPRKANDGVIKYGPQKQYADGKMEQIAESIRKLI